MGIFKPGSESAKGKVDTMHAEYLLRQTAKKLENNLSSFHSVIASNMDFKIKQGSISAPNPVNYAVGYKRAYNYLRKMQNKAEIIRNYEKDLSLPRAGVLEAVKALTEYFESIEEKRDTFFRKKLDELTSKVKNSVGGYLKDE